MSLPDQKPARKSHRLGIYLPIALLLILAAVWSALWFKGRDAAVAQMDAAVARLKRSGYLIDWDTRTVGGFPFRIDVTLTNASAREPSGWAARAPRLEAEAYLYAPSHWIMAAQQGVTLDRPESGPVTITGRIVRASLSDPAARPPSFDFQALDATFQPAPGANPFPLKSAGKAEVHLRAGPDDAAGLFVSVENGRGRDGGVLAKISGGKPVALAWDATLSRMSDFRDADWGAAVRRWSEAGGVMSVRSTSQLTAGDAKLAVRTGNLRVGGDGRLRGVLATSLRQAPQGLAAMAESGLVTGANAQAASAVAAAGQQGDLVQADIVFEAGQTTLGPAALGPAPKVYTPHVDPAPLAHLGVP
jgi:hypothetical protein